MTVLSASFGQPFDEQLAALRLRFLHLVPSERWDDLQHAAHERAFVVAGAMKAALLADLANAVDKANSSHRSLDKFREEFLKLAEAHNWKGWAGQGTKKGEAWRARVIYRTNMATSYAAGRMAQLVDGDFKFWVYKHGNALEPRLQHLAWDGIALPPDHPFWQTHAPPNGWGCTCRIRGADSEAGIRRAKGDPNKALPDGWQAKDPKTGAPVGIDRGWDYAPGRSVAETVTLAAKKIAAVDPKIGSDFGAGLQGLISRAWPTWLADTTLNGSHEPGLAGVLSRDILRALEAKGVAPASAEIMVKAGILVGPKAKRHEASGDNLSADDWLALPDLLQRPSAILLDKVSGALVYILPAEGRRPQLALRLDYRTKLNRATRITNMVVSAYLASPPALLSRIASGKLLLIFGAIG